MTSNTVDEHPFATHATLLTAVMAAFLAATFKY